MSLYAAGSGEDRKQRLMREALPRRKAMMVEMRRLRECAEPEPDESDQKPEFEFENFEELVDFLQMAEADKWIDKAVKKPGRCKDFGGPDCPPGSPQYNLAKRFKKGGDLYKKAHE